MTFDFSVANLSHPLALAAAWLLTYLVHSTIFLCAAFIALRLLKCRAAALREWVLKVALLAGIATASIQMLLPAAAAALEIPVFLTLPGAENATGIFCEGADGGAEPKPERMLADSVLSAERQYRESIDPGLRWPDALTLTWLAGALGITAWTARSRLQLRRLIGGLEPMSVDNAGFGLRALCRRAGISADVRLYRAPSGAGIFAVAGKGIYASEAALAGLSKKGRESVLLHELAHLRRRDSLWFALLGVLRDLLFLQPLNWLAVRMLQADAEECCDQFALKHSSDPEALVEAIIKIGRLQCAATPAPAAVGRRQSHIERRAGRILSWRGSQEPKRFGLLVAAVALLLTLTLAAALAPKIDITVLHMAPRPLHEKLPAGTTPERAESEMDLPSERAGFSERHKPQFFYYLCLHL